MNRGLPRELRKKYFSRSGIRWQIDSEIRDMVEFRNLNLVDPMQTYPPSDVVFMRNVLIYFERDLQREILGRLHELLDPFSYVFLGGTETPLGLDDRFERVDDFPRSGCYRLERT